MSFWTHAICWKCFQVRVPGATPVTSTGLNRKKVCCFCGEETMDGIFVRESGDAVELRCKGECKNG